MSKANSCVSRRLSIIVCLLALVSEQSCVLVNPEPDAFDRILIGSREKDVRRIMLGWQKKSPISRYSSPMYEISSPGLIHWLALCYRNGEVVTKCDCVVRDGERFKRFTVKIVTVLERDEINLLNEWMRTNNARAIFGWAAIQKFAMCGDPFAQLLVIAFVEALMPDFSCIEAPVPGYPSISLKRKLSVSALSEASATYYSVGRKTELFTETNADGKFHARWSYGEIVYRSLKVEVLDGNKCRIDVSWRLPERIKGENENF